MSLEGIELVVYRICLLRKPFIVRPHISGSLTGFPDCTCGRTTCISTSDYSKLRSQFQASIINDFFFTLASQPTSLITVSRAVHPALVSFPVL
jgi:hypothetical protein